MPGILIKEQEDLSLGQLSVIENVVLVPLFVSDYLIDDYDKEVRVKKYTQYNKFKNDVLRGGIGNACILLKDYLDENTDDTSGKTKTRAKRPEQFDIKIPEYNSEGKIVNYRYYNVDQSYQYIAELLGMGLHVVVKFIGPDLIEAAGYEIDSEGRLVHDHSSEEEYDRGDDLNTFDETLEEILNKLIKDEGVYPYGIYEEFKDRNLYNLKFITTGAHSNLLIERNSDGDKVDKDLSCYQTLIKVAAKRGDALALVEIENNYDLTKETFINKEQLLQDFKISDHTFEFAACFYPWGIYQMNFTDSKNHEMPASFGYLMAFAYSIQINDDWFAASGVSRGFIPNLISLNYEVGDSFMHVLQSDEQVWYDRDDYAVDGAIEGDYLPIRINPIMFKGAYGNRVWGNRTFGFLGEDGIRSDTHSNVSFREYLNVRMLLCDIKKQIYGAATRVTFEPNDDITWLNFKGLVNNLLDRMQNGRGLEWYHWYKEFPDDGHGNRRKATIKATLSIKPIEAVEYFDITIYLTDEDAVVAEPVL